jgi:ubiquinone/menaquinone biosynthesis C-methylase UbiE
MTTPTVSIHEKNRPLQAKYDITSWLYDILDYPWERQYRRWRPALLDDVRGEVLEAGVGTGRNLEYYHTNVNLTGIDICLEMLRRAMKRARSAVCGLELRQEDATIMASIPSEHFDWIISTFLCCVMPDHLQPLAIKQFQRVLKPGGKFKLLEIVYSKNHKIRKHQEKLTWIVEKVYGARFDRGTLGHLEGARDLRITNTWFIKKDIYMVIEGMRVN